jgi:YVTN family beta-propeller protein
LKSRPCETPESHRGRAKSASGRRRTARVYVGLENEDKVAVVDTLANRVIAESPVGQAPQALVYVPNAIAAESGGGNVAMTTMPVVPDQAGRELCNHSR